MINFYLNLPLWMKIGIPVFFAAVTALLVYSIVRRGRWVDRGFMEREGKTLYLEDRRFPLGVIYDDMIDEKWVETWKIAVYQFQAIVGKRILFVGPIPATPTMLDQFGWPPQGFIHLSCEDGKRGSCVRHQFDPKTGEVACALVIFGEWTQRTSIKEALHEIGHVLLLAHDEQRESIMHPVIQERTQTITDDDKKRLQKRYAA